MKRYNLFILTLLIICAIEVCVVKAQAPIPGPPYGIQVTTLATYSPVAAPGYSSTDATYYICNGLSMSLQTNVPTGGPYNDGACPPNCPVRKYKIHWQSSFNGTSNWTNVSNGSGSTYITDSYKPIMYWRCCLVTDDGKYYYPNSSPDPSGQGVPVITVIHSDQIETAPFNIHTTDVTATGFTANWDPISQPTWTNGSGTDGKCIVLALKDMTTNTDWNFGGGATAVVVPGGESATSYTMTGLTAGHKYCWKVHTAIINGYTTGICGPATFQPTCATGPCKMCPCFANNNYSSCTEFTAGGGSTPPPSPLCPTPPCPDPPTPPPCTPMPCPPAPKPPVDTVPTKPVPTTCDSVAFFSAYPPPNFAGFTYAGRMSNHYYYISTATDNFTNARANSFGQGKHLVVITSAAENTFVQGLLGGNIVWIGALDTLVNNVWKWVDNTAWGYTNWSGGAGPPRPIATNPGVIDSANGKWANVPYATTYKYLMEYVPTQWNDTTITKRTGQNVSINVVVYGDTTNLSYQWYKDGEIITGATSENYSIAKFNEEDQGTYTCQVKNSCGYAWSRKFILVWSGC